MLKINEYFYHLKGKDLFVQKNHSHNEIECIQVVNGNGFIIKNDKTYIMQSQRLYVIDARNTHIVYPEPKELENYVRNKIVIDADSFESFCSAIGLDGIMDQLLDSDPISTVNDPEIDATFKMVSALCSTGEAKNIGFAHGCIVDLLYYVHSKFSDKKSGEEKGTIQQVLDIINEKEGVTSLNEIAGILYMDKCYLSHLFKSKTGVTLSSYLSEKIYEKSRRLIESTSYSLEKISEMCGFSSAACFARFFKSKSGIAPSKYRNEKSTLMVKS